MSIMIYGRIYKLLFESKSLPYNMVVRKMRTRHRTARFLIMNNYQPWPINPDVKKIFHDFDKLNPSELRDNLRRIGMLSKNSFTDRDINLSCTDVIFDRFVPPEGDGKLSILSPARYTGSTSSAVKNTISSRKMKKYDSNFDKKQFPLIAEEIYRKVLNILPNYKSNEGRLLELVTEKGLSDMLKGLEFKTLMHTFHKHLENPSVVSYRTEKGVVESQIFGQIIVRFFSQQTIAIFDKFGRLIYGSHDTPQDLLEYVVFEKQISEEYSQWRIHAKIVPNWVKSSLVCHRTSRIADEPVETPS